MPGLPIQRLMKFLNELDTKAPHEDPDFRRRRSAAGRLRPGVRLHNDRGALAFRSSLRPRSCCEDRVRNARVTGIRRLAYPIWGWTLADDTPIEETTVRGWRLGIAPYLTAKRRAIHAHASQYGQLITDDPAGFELPTALLRAFDEPWETFLSP